MLGVRAVIAQAPPLYESTVPTGEGNKGGKKMWEKNVVGKKCGGTFLLPVRGAVDVLSGGREGLDL